MRVIGGVYLLHFEPTIHYAGFSLDIATRLAQHQSGSGCLFTGRLVKSGYEPHLVRIWEDGDFEFERAVKSKAMPTLCPICEMRKAKSEAPVTIDEDLISRAGWRAGITKTEVYRGRKRG